MIGTGPFRLKSGTPNTARRARPLPRVLGRQPAARRCGVHVVRGHRTAGSRTAWGADRPCCPALPQEAAALQEQHRFKFFTVPSSLTGCSACGPIANRSGTRECDAPSRWCSTVPDISGGSSSVRARLATTLRSGRSSRPPTRRSSSASRTSRSRELCSSAAGAGESQVHDHDVERDRPPRPCAGDPGRGAPGGHRHRARGQSIAEYYGGGADYYATTRGSTARDAHRVRRSRRAEPVPHGRVHVRRDLECLALQERRVRHGCRSYLESPDVAAQRRATKQHGRPPSARHAGRHRLLHHLRHRQLVQGPNYRPEAISHMRLAKTFLGSVIDPAAGATGVRPSDTDGCRYAIARYVLKRLGLAIITLLLLSVIVFATSQLLPGNVGRAVLGRDATEEAVAEYNRDTAPTGRPSSSTSTGWRAPCRATSGTPCRRASRSGTSFGRHSPTH